MGGEDGVNPIAVGSLCWLGFVRVKDEVSYVLGSKLPLFSYNRGQTHQPKSVGVYIPIIDHFNKDSLLKVGFSHPQYKEFFSPWLI